MEKEQARDIPCRWIERRLHLPDEEVVLTPSSTLERDFGWMFF